MHSAPEFLELDHAIVSLVARDDAGIDGANCSTDDPVWFYSCLVQRLINPALISAERSVTLQDDHNLAWARWLTNGSVGSGLLQLVAVIGENPFKTGC
jgi:hypothetical protein